MSEEIPGGPGDPNNERHNQRQPGTEGSNRSFGHGGVHPNSPARRLSDVPALAHLETRVVRIESEVATMRKNIDLLIDSLPSRSPDEHTEHHEDYAEVLKARKEKEEEDKKLKKELKAKLTKTVLQAIFMAVMVIMGLGLQVQFSKWVNAAVEERAAKIAPVAPSQPSYPVAPPPH